MFKIRFISCKIKKRHFILFAQNKVSQVRGGGGMRQYPKFHILFLFRKLPLVTKNHFESVQKDKKNLVTNVSLKLKQIKSLQHSFVLGFKQTKF